MNSLTFRDLSNSILNLFEKKDERLHNCIDLLGGNVGLMGVHKTLITSFIGYIDEFYNWLKPKLEEFFEHFDTHFRTKNERINRRRYYRYESIIKSKSCKRRAFKREMMNEIKLDIISFLKDGEYVGEYTDTEENRRMLLLNCIKDYVYRSFLIDAHCYP